VTKQQFLDAVPKSGISAWLTEWSLNLINTPIKPDQDITALFLNDVNNHLIKTERNGAA